MLVAQARTPAGLAQWSAALVHSSVGSARSPVGSVRFPAGSVISLVDSVRFRVGWDLDTARLPVGLVWLQVDLGK